MHWRFKQLHDSEQCSRRSTQISEETTKMTPQSTMSGYNADNGSNDCPPLRRIVVVFSSDEEDTSAEDDNNNDNNDNDNNHNDKIVRNLPESMPLQRRVPPKAHFRCRNLYVGTSDEEEMNIMKANIGDDDNKEVSADPLSGAILSFRNEEPVSPMNADDLYDNFHDIWQRRKVTEREQEEKRAHLVWKYGKEYANNVMDNGYDDISIGPNCDRLPWHIIRELRDADSYLESKKDFLESQNKCWEEEALLVRKIKNDRVRLMLKYGGMYVRKIMNDNADDISIENGQLQLPKHIRRELRNEDAYMKQKQNVLAANGRYWDRSAKKVRRISWPEHMTEEEREMVEYVEGRKLHLQWKYGYEYAWRVINCGYEDISVNHSSGYYQLPEHLQSELRDEDSYMETKRDFLESKNLYWDSHARIVREINDPKIMKDQKDYDDGNSKAEGSNSDDNDEGQDNEDNDSSSNVTEVDIWLEGWTTLLSESSKKNVQEWAWLCWKYGKNAKKVATDPDFDDVSLSSVNSVLPYHVKKLLRDEAAYIESKKPYLESRKRYWDEEWQCVRIKCRDS